MLISSPSFVVHSYSDWYYTLIAKDISNTYSEMQNISVMGMLRHFVSTKHLNELIILPAAVLYAIPLLRRKQFKELSFRLSYLAFALIGIVIFSSSAESPTYIIAVTGVAIWYTTQRKKNVAVLSLLILTFLITSLSATDLFPSFIRTNFIRPYALKALPCFLVWIVISFQLMFKNFKIPGKPAEVFQSY